VAFLDTSPVAGVLGHTASADRGPERWAFWDYVEGGVMWTGWSGGSVQAGERGDRWLGVFIIRLL
jgi:hypothetical protein